MGEGHYHFHTKLISRSQGRAICAAAAYRSAERIYDERYGKTFDYTPRTSIHAVEIRAPAHAPDWMKDRSQLWNGVEAFETRKNSRLAREFEVSVPHELTAEQRKQAVRQFVDSELVSRGMVADVAYHDFTGKHSHNPHAHILVTTREIEGSTFSRKKTREWDKEETLTHWREAWAKHVNHALEQAHSQTRVDHRSYRERGITKTPVSESQGEWHQRQKEIAAANRQLEQANRELAALEKEQKQERVDRITQIGADIARTHAVQQQQAKLAQAAREAFELGQKLAREQQTQKPPQPKPEPEPQPPPRSAKPTRNRGLEPWKRDWEKQHDEQRKRRIASEKEQERKASIQRSEATRQEKKPQPQPPVSQPDERQLIEQWKQYHDRERGESRADGQVDQAATPARDTTPEQQAAKLAERMAEFEAKVKWLKENYKEPPLRKPKPQPPEPPPERKHDRGISM